MFARGECSVPFTFHRTPDHLERSSICSQRDQRLNGDYSSPFEGGGGIPSQPVELPAAILLLSHCQRIEMRFDHFIGEQTARQALGTRGEAERAVCFFLRGRAECDQLLLQDFRSNANKDLRRSLSI